MIYYYFGGKDGLLRAVLQAAMDSLGAAPFAPTARAQIALIAETYLRLGDRNPSQCRLLLHAVQRSLPGAPKMLVEHCRRLQLAWVESLQLPPGPQRWALAAAFFGMLPIYQRADGSARARAQELAELLCSDLDRLTEKRRHSEEQGSR